MGELGNFTNTIACLNMADYFFETQDKIVFPQTLILKAFFHMIKGRFDHMVERGGGKPKILLNMTNYDRGVVRGWSGHQKTC